VKIKYWQNGKEKSLTTNNPMEILAKESLWDRWVIVR
jgi:hypothetical protein